MKPPALNSPRTSLMAFFSLAFAALSIAAPDMRPASVERTVLRIARSKDGLSFKVDEADFLNRATSPTMTQLNNGSLIVMVDYDLSSEDKNEATQLSVMRSGDNGKTWSPLRAVKLDAPDPIRQTANSASFARTPDGKLSVFFASTPVKTKKSSPTMIFSAATRNGLDYRVNRSMRVGLPNSREAHPIAVLTKGRLHLLIDRVAKGKGRKADEPVLEHFVSPDGADFARLGPRRFDKTRFVGDVIPFAEGYRAYVTTSAGIRSFVSKDLREWKPEGGLRIPRGWDPTVTKLKNGTYLMVYCANAKNDAKGRSSVVDTTDYGADFDASLWTVEADTGSGEKVASAESSEDPPDWIIDPANKDDWWEYWDPEETDGFAPPPDFQTKVDYFSWYSDYLLPDPQDNAYDAYAEFMPGLYPGPDGAPELPEIKDMFSDDSFDGPPGPWDPEDHPDWAESNENLQEILDQFHEASKKTDYAIPPHTDLEFSEEKTDDQRLLMGLLLPNLSGHRKLSRAALADAWRVDENGKVSPERMEKSIETALRAANHLDQGHTLIEELVATAERNRVHETALRALEHDVFSSDELESVLEKLQSLDQPLSDPAKGGRGEHGFAMDISQYLFSPPTEDGLPKFNRKRAEKIAGFAGDKAKQFVEDVSKMKPDDVFDSVDAFNRHYTELTAQIRVGYPHVRGEDIEALEEENLHTTPLTSHLMPRLSRYYRRKARAEASRRATQLTYAVHLYKKRNGKWPASLSELPANHSTGSRTDPFTGDDFKYEITDSGPRIYSLSEDATDNGGKHSQSWSASEDNDSDDYVFWPPQPKK